MSGPEVWAAFVLDRVSGIEYRICWLEMLAGRGWLCVSVNSEPTLKPDAIGGHCVQEDDGCL
jgi:hypothetical protein